MSTDVATIELTAEEQYTLESCALDINKAGRTAMAALLEMGKAAKIAHDLLASKRCGAFKDWIEDKCQVHWSYVYKSIRVFDEYGRLDIGTGSKLPVKAALMLVCDSAPQEARDEVLGRIESGDVPTTHECKEIISRAKTQNARTERDESAVDGMGGDAEESGSDDPDAGGAWADRDAEPPAQGDELRAQAPGPAEPNKIGALREKIKALILLNLDGEAPAVRMAVGQYLVDVVAPELGVLP